MWRNDRLQRWNWRWGKKSHVEGLVLHLSDPGNLVYRTKISLTLHGQIRIISWSFQRTDVLPAMAKTSFVATWLENACPRNTSATERLIVETVVTSMGALIGRQGTFGTLHTHSCVQSFVGWPRINIFLLVACLTNLGVWITPASTPHADVMESGIARWVHQIK